MRFAAHAGSALILSLLRLTGTDVAPPGEKLIALIGLSALKHIEHLVDHAFQKADSVLGGVA